MNRDSTRLRTLTLAMLAAVVIGFSLARGTAGAVGVATMQVTVTERGYQVRPEVSAGRYQLTIENLSGQKADLVLVRVPDGWSTEDTRAVIATGAGSLASGPFEQTRLERAEVPYVIYAGQAAPHGQGKAVVTFVAGTWLVMSGHAGIDSTFSEFTVGSAQ
jgi:hypothetical protein